MVEVDLGGCVKYYGEVGVHSGVGGHGDDGHGMNFSQPNVTKRFRGSWLITFQPFVTCFSFSSHLVKT